MKKTLLKVFILIVVFLAALYLVSGLMNQGNSDMTAQMGPAAYPLVYILADGHKINCLRGYADSMESNYLRESLTPLGEGRSLRFMADKYNYKISKLSFEVRSIDGSRLIEDTAIENYEEDQDQIVADINIKDLIEPEQEYTLIILMANDRGELIRFYTRIFIPTECYVAEKMNYVYEFHEKTFDKEEARELTKYLESNAEGDNTTYGQVTIHSSFDQVTWGDLAVTKATEPILYIKEMSRQTASFRLKYDVLLSEGGQNTRFWVEEYYRIRYTPDRIYLLDFERTMEQIFIGDPQKIVNSKINLGITDADIPMMESDGGNVFAFEVQNSLYSYIIADHKFIRLFSFYDEQNNDARSAFGGHRSRLLNVDEAGNVVFMVYGYMNRGRYEGQVGISVYYYDSKVNTVEELVYVPYQKSPELLIAEIEQLVYLNRNGRLFVMMDNEVYSIHLNEGRAETLVMGMQEGSYHISASNKMLVWQSSPEVFAADRLILMNLQNETKTEVAARSDEYIQPLGFMDEDLIYGLAKKEDITRDRLGKTIFPMYRIKIQSESGQILKEHYQPELYVSGLTIQNNQITLHRLKKNETGDYEATTDTQITNKVIAAENINKVEVVATEKYEKVVQIAIKQEVDTAAVKLLTPREVLFEGDRMMQLREGGLGIKRYYVFGKNGIEGIYLSESAAVNIASVIAGVVLDNQGEYVWQKGNLALSNQITAIEGQLVTESESTLAICLDVIMEYEGVVGNAQYLLRQGNSVADILQNNIENIQVLDLGGCDLDSVLYYVNRDIPVLATLSDGNAVVIVGFNEATVMIMDPLTGGVYRKGRNDSAAWLEENGNSFISYIYFRE